MRPALALALVGCAEGPDPVTLVDGVELVAAIAEPPEVAAGEPFALTALIGDPREEGVDVVIWWCSPAGGPCVVERPEVADGLATAELVATAVGPLWVVACATAIGCDPAERDLRDPYRWLQGLPLDGVSLGTRGIDLTELPADERRANPQVTGSPSFERLADVGEEEVVTLRFTAAGAERAAGLATGGGFSRPSEEVASDGTVSLDWIAPTDAGEVTLWVVFDDGLGGTAVWTAVASVR